MNEHSADAAAQVAPDQGTAPQQMRTVDDVESLRALADPTRLAILTALMEARHGELPVMSVKDLAAELGEPQTKLYRHVRQLEAAGLIHVAATRMVSGILEQRYQASQHDLMFGPGFLRQHLDESAAAIRTVLDRFGDEFTAAFRESGPDDAAAEEASHRPTIMASEVRVSAPMAARLRARLREVMDEFNAAELERDPDGVLVNVLIGYYTMADRNRS